MEEKEQVLIEDEVSLQIVAAAERIAIASGAERVTVRSVLQALGITNRVFYNRFRNIDQVLDIVYQRMVLKIRESIATGFDLAGDFFEQVIDIVANTLQLSYDTKMNFNHYIFEADSVSNSNYAWWKAEIARLMELGKQQGHLKQSLDTDIMSYAIWCFIRGYNADALGRKLPRDKAVADFKYSFGILLDGMRA